MKTINCSNILRHTPFTFEIIYIYIVAVDQQMGNVCTLEEDNLLLPGKVHEQWTTQHQTNEQSPQNDCHMILTDSASHK